MAARSRPERRAANAACVLILYCSSQRSAWHARVRCEHPRSPHRMITSLHYFTALAHLWLLMFSVFLQFLSSAPAPAPEDDVGLTSASTWTQSRQLRDGITSRQLLTCQVPKWYRETFDMTSRIEDAKSLLSDGNLSSLRYELVPAAMAEEDFWRSFFYLIEHPRREQSNCGSRASGKAKDAAAAMCSSEKGSV